MFAASVVQTNRAVCLSSDQCTLSVSTPCRVSQALVLGEVAADRADEHRPQAEQTQPVGHVRAGPAPVLHEVVDEEGERDVLHLALDELLDELPREGHQVVGGDGAGDGDGHGTLPLVLARRNGPRDVECPAAERAHRTA